jgi:Ca2+-transporting ATPase
MITGDQPLTAAAIAGKLQMTEGEPKAMTGAELGELKEGELKKEIGKITVFARVSPAQKLDIVKTLQENGQFVAMTGDGVNDAPSLKQADIGIAMGITGTDVTKESSDMILLDDNFATIVKAVKTGRRIYDNIRKFILYVLACNLAEILTIFLAPFLGLAIPLLPIHILWINLVTDGLPGLALSNEPAEPDIMKRPPRPPKESLFAQGMVPKILLQGSIMAGTALYLQWWAVQQGYSVVVQQTMVFSLLCFAQLAHVMSVRSNDHLIFKKYILSNRPLWGAVLFTILLQLALLYIPALHPIFKTTSLAWKEMGVVMLMTGISLVGFEGSKLLVSRFFLRKDSKSNTQYSTIK